MKIIVISIIFFILINISFAGKCLCQNEAASRVACENTRGKPFFGSACSLACCINWDQVQDFHIACALNGGGTIGRCFDCTSC